MFPETLEISPEMQTFLSSVLIKYKQTKRNITPFINVYLYLFGTRYLFNVNNTFI